MLVLTPLQSHRKRHYTTLHPHRLPTLTCPKKERGKRKHGREVSVTNPYYSNAVWAFPSGYPLLGVRWTGNICRKSVMLESFLMDFPSIRFSTSPNLRLARRTKTGYRKASSPLVFWNRDVLRLIIGTIHRGLHSSNLRAQFQSKGDNPVIYQGTDSRYLYAFAYHALN